jgi:tRNA pseudouridine55 synthase
MQRTEVHGLLVLDKPGGMTSRDVVNRVQRWFPRGTKIGHAGTLDPLATGVLVLGLGQATRLIEYVQRMAKEYHAGLRLGARSDSDDADGRIEEVAVRQPPARGQVEACLRCFVGEIEQVPPAYSAAKVAGQRAYDLARRGEGVELEARRVRIDRIAIEAYEFPRLELRVTCGKGTYIRSLARDLGEQLSCGAFVETLRRTRIGNFLAAEALTLETRPEEARARLLPCRAALAGMPEVVLDDASLSRFRSGQPFGLGEAERAADAEVAVFDRSGRVAGVASCDAAGRRLMPVKVFAQPV